LPPILNLRQIILFQEAQWKAHLVLNAREKLADKTTPYLRAINTTERLMVPPMGPGAIKQI